MYVYQYKYGHDCLKMPVFSDLDKITTTYTAVQSQKGKSEQLLPFAFAEQNSDNS